MDRISLYEELRLIERSENEVNGAWKGAHLLLFFLAFVFGSFCTFCFHMLMYLFDEKCVLFPKLLSLTSLRHNVIYEFVPEEKERADSLPVDFLSTQWVEKSACYLPTYVPLISGIFGLVWTTMFLMCSSGARSLNGLQRSWRIIPPVLIFSLAMSGLCIYSSAVTHYGLRELCFKLGEITGSSTCSYTVNVATLAYERQIRGVYQATRLTITSAWMHTACWLASAFLAIARILLAVDFRLVKIRVELVGDIDKLLERNERQLRTVLPNQGTDDDEHTSNASFTSAQSLTSAQTYFRNEQFDEANGTEHVDFEGNTLFISKQPVQLSKLSLLPEELHRLARVKGYEKISKEHQFIVDIVFDLLDVIDHVLGDYSPTNTWSSVELYSDERLITRQYGQQTIMSKVEQSDATSYEPVNNEEAEELYKEIKQHLQKHLNEQFSDKLLNDDSSSPGTSIRKDRVVVESSAETLYGSVTNYDKSEGFVQKKSKLKSEPNEIKIQTEKKLAKMARKSSRRVTIAASENSLPKIRDDDHSANTKEDSTEKDSTLIDTEDDNSEKKNNESQAKEKQD